MWNDQSITLALQIANLSLCLRHETEYKNRLLTLTLAHDSRRLLQREPSYTPIDQRHNA